ncbi:class I SAM-dependent RNA methyltransferase [Pilimelia columellifera]|uniref:TRAM domain-containing protein n=1 Tax=Pilimelia columellifera subsp. columellifera TaxID=706583 RepID=A0ABN3N2S7_9ACTN
MTLQQIDDQIELVEGDRLELTVGAVAHGGHCVARFGPAPGRVVFVRHALPGERVIAEITEIHRGYLRADAIEIVVSSADRVAPPCPWSGPDACGGCDFQHVALPGQRSMKAAVIKEQLTRLGGLDADQVDALGVRVDALPGDIDGLGWRTRVRYTVAASDHAGLRKHRSNEIVPIDHCRIAHPSIQAVDVLKRPWPGVDSISVAASSTGELAVIADHHVVEGPERLTETASGRTWQLAAGAFWQVHPAAAEALTAAVAALLAPRPGDVVWDLYGGTGLFAGAIAETVGETGAVTVVEADPRGAVAAAANLADLPWVKVVNATVEAALRQRALRGAADLVILDPPRAGAGARVVRALAGSGARAIAYVACDPAALARDVRTFAEQGWELQLLRAFDCFPMTHHVECVALFTPAGAPAG